MLYTVQAVANVKQGHGAYVTVPLPTFYLDSNVQGIVNADHATRIARHMLLSIMPAGSGLSVSVEPEYTNPTDAEVRASLERCRADRRASTCDQDDIY